MKTLSHKHTLIACFSGYITQAIVVNFIPLLFISFCTGFGISLERVTILVTVNFLVQLLTDLVSAKLIGKIGYRAGIVGANVLATFGLIFMALMPGVIDPYVSLVAGMVMCAIGSGLEEVLISPIVEACPTKNKSAIMSLTHSFYCWGTVVIIGLSTLFFLFFGTQNWKTLTLIWAVIPTINAILFSTVPIYNDKEYGGHGGGFKKLFSSKIFWLFALLMVCAGASEISMGQWASAFAESALGVDKVIGDLIGPCLFALMMATARTLYAVFSEKINLPKFIIACSVLCVITYALAVFSPFEWMSLVACGLCGFAVGMMWPGTLSIAAAKIGGSTALFAMYAVFGDIGATVGPTIVGFVSGAFNDDLKKGLACVMVFPIIIIVGMIISLKKKRKNLPLTEKTEK